MRSLMIAAVLCAVSMVAAQTPPGPVVVTPADNGAALINPDMGWTMMFYSNHLENYGSRLAPSDDMAWFPGCSVVYLRLPWSLLEPREGQFNWSLLDTPAQRWIARGGKVALRVTCCESWMRYATPKWVVDAGAKGVDYEFGKGPRKDGPLWEPDYLDPVFLKKLDHLLAALAEHYDNNPNVAFIDIGTFGMWGEGHTGFSSRLDQQQTDAAVRKQIDMYLAHFHHTQLAINDDVVGHNSPGPHHMLTDYAHDHGITLRDDSILVQPPPNSWYHADLAQTFWPDTPVIIEHEHYGPSKARGAWSGDLLVKSVEDYHASYMSIHWWPHEYDKDNRDMIDRINKRLGYRLQLRKIAWPARVSSTQAVGVAMTWANAGVAPCYPGGFVALTLKDDKGGIAAVHVDPSLNVRDLKVGPPDAIPTTDASFDFSMGLPRQDPTDRVDPRVAAGKYDVFVSVGRRDGTPTIALPLDHDDGLHRYRLGSITVTP